MQIETYAIFNCLTRNHIMLYVEGTRYLEGLDLSRARRLRLIETHYTAKLAPLQRMVKF